jgi:4-diphosphocytidyl-2-C-methyl-D-erythritol kinase
LIKFPNCKINLGLHITGKRDDGYHNLETVFYPVPLTDALEILPQSHFEFTTSGLAIQGDPAKNLCVKAYDLLKTDFDLPPVHMHLHKAIPMGAGLGGGSSNGAFALLIFNELFDLCLQQQQLIDYALQLGSDCPFFVVNTPCFAFGRGEMLEPFTLSLSGYQLVLANPGIHVSTAWAFSQIVPSPASAHLAEIVQQPVSQWKGQLCNDFEEPVCKSYPLVKELIDYFYAQGAHYAAMTGSGSTVFGLLPPELSASPPPALNLALYKVLAL